MIPSLPTVVPPRNVLVAILALVLFDHKATHGAETRQVTLQDFLSKLGYEVMPLTRARNNCLFINGKVNGRKAVILIDTGANVTAIDKTKATGMKRVEKLKKEMIGLFGVVATEESIVMIENLEIGASGFEAQPAAVLNLHTGRETHVGSLIPTSHRVKEYDVVLGLDFLGRNYAIIDSHKPSLFLRKKKPDADIAASVEHSLKAGGFVPVPLVRRDFHIDVAGAVNDHPANFLLDTGSFVTLVDGNQTDDLGLSVRGRLGVVFDVGGKTSGLTFTRIETLRFGDFALE